MSHLSTSIYFSASLSGMKSENYYMRIYTTFLHHVEKVNFSTILLMYLFLHRSEKEDFSTRVLIVVLKLVFRIVTPSEKNSILCSLCKSVHILWNFIPGPRGMYVFVFQKSGHTNIINGWWDLPMKTELRPVRIEDL